jgi:flagellar export protein FliJ
MKPTSQDAGLRAVARVRAVREQDSRFGLQQAVREQRQHEHEAIELRGRLEHSGAFAAGATGSYLALRASLAAVGAALRAAEAQAASSRTISEAAYGRWQQDKARLSAVELLLDRRAAERRADTLRREARELDELSVQRWRRRGAEGGPS